MQQNNHTTQNVQQENNVQENTNNIQENTNNTQENTNGAPTPARSRLPLVLLGGTTATIAWASLALLITEHPLSPSVIAATTAITGAEVAAASAIAYSSYRCTQMAVRGTRAAVNHTYQGAKAIVNSSLEIASSKTSELKNFISKKRSRDEESNQDMPDAKRHATAETISEEEQVIPPTREAEQVNTEQSLPSSRDTYESSAQTLTQRINLLKAELDKKANQCKTVTKKLQEILRDAPDANFLENGSLASEQPARNKVQCLRWTEKAFTNLLETPKAERSKLKSVLINKAKNKINKPSSTDKIKI